MRSACCPAFATTFEFFLGDLDRDADGSWSIIAAPYVADVISFGLSAVLLAVCRIQPIGRRLLLMIDVVSPVLDLAYGYQGGFWRPPRSPREVVGRD